MKLLIERGADLDSKNSVSFIIIVITTTITITSMIIIIQDNRTPLDVAQKFGKNDNAALLRQAVESKSNKKKEEAALMAEEAKRKKKAPKEEKKQLKDIISKIDKMVDLQTTSATVSSDGLLVDKKYKLAPQEAAENDYIASDPLLLSFSNCMQMSWNQSLIAASVIGTSQLSLQESSSAVKTLSILSQISSSLPFASIIFSGAASVVSSISSAHKEIEFRNLAALVPTSDAVDMSILSSAVARCFTLSYHDEIKRGAYNKNNNNNFSKMKDMFVTAIDTIDSKLARSFTCQDGLDWLAADMSRICISYIFNCNVLDLSQLVAELTRDRNGFTHRLVDLVKDTYPVSKPMVVAISQSSVGTTGGVSGFINLHHHL